LGSALAGKQSITIADAGRNDADHAEGLARSR